MQSGQTEAPRLNRRDVVLLATADWDHPFWTNKQHVAATLAKLGHRVLYVESVGLRAPRLEGQDLRRIWRRLCRGCRPPRCVAPRLWVWSPLLIPAAHSGWRRRVNQVVFSVLLRAWRAWLGLKADLFWTYNPLTGLLLALPLKGYRQLVYHCVDDLTAQPCMPSALIKAEEAKLCRHSDQIFVTSPELLRTRSVYNQSIRYDSNVADVSHFAAARQMDGPIPLDLEELPEGPRLGFIGAISAYKLDLDLLAALAEHRPDCQIVLIGRVGEGDPNTALDSLLRYPNLHHLGPKPYGQLPDYLRGFNAALLPSPINDYTRSMFPMKFFEYLAAGVPVVATDLPALRDHGDLATLCPTRDDFLSAVDRLIPRGGSTKDRSAAIPLDQLPACCSYQERTLSMLSELERRLSHPLTQ